MVVPDGKTSPLACEHTTEAVASPPSTVLAVTAAQNTGEPPAVLCEVEMKPSTLAGHCSWVKYVGASEGACVGAPLGCALGPYVSPGGSVGVSLGADVVGTALGLNVGRLVVGASVGCAVGTAVGCGVASPGAYDVSAIMSAFETAASKMDRE